MGEYLQEIFESRIVGDFEGNGCDWGSLAQAFSDEKRPYFKEKIGLDQEADMFCAYSKDSDALYEFMRSFRKVCEDKALILDLFLTSELD